jgi:4-amino-4-deoxy-L-arabinose transferase-like glycosyltransferase
VSDFLDFIVALLVVTPLNLFILSRIERSLPGDEGRFVSNLYRWTLVLRALVALWLATAIDDRSIRALFWGDSSQYDFAGRQLVLYWSGQLLDPPVLKVTGFGFGYLVGFVYWIFGPNQILMQLVNATLGSLSVVVIYAIARDLFDEASARWAGRFMAFFPQMIIWSAGLYKDPAILLCISVSMYAVLKLKRGLSPLLLLVYFAALLSLLSLRFYVFYIVAFATLGTFAFTEKRSFASALAIQVALIAVFAAAFSFAAGTETVEHHVEMVDLEHVQHARADQSQAGASGIDEEADVSTASGALSVLPVGLAYLLFAPFPWAISGLRQAMTLPETLVWYSLMPAFVRGLLYAIRHRFRDTLPILVFTATLTLAYAIFQGNVGTAYRQRTQITMFFFILMGVGLTQKQRAAAVRGAAAVRPAMSR